MNQDFSVRDASVADAEAIAGIYNAWIDQGNATMDLVHWSEDCVSARLGSLEPRECLLVVGNGSQVCGWGIVKKYSPRLGYRVSCETSLYVDNAFTGMGLGSALLEALFKRCRRHGYRHAVARIIASNTASIAFHRRHGFELVGIQKEVGYKRGKWCDAAIMQKIFPDVPPPDDGR